MSAEFKLRCVLFDLDGTLVDTAPDLIACLNSALIEHGFDSVPASLVRPFISYGAAVMIEKSEQVSAKEMQAQVLETMLNHYEANIMEHGNFFLGMAETLAHIEEQGLKWGIVTNKHTRFTAPLTQALNLTKRAACIISGDTTSRAKPYPEPMLEACKRADVSPLECVYIGDAKHDISAGKAVQMKTLAALYGYLTAEDRPEEWGADGMVNSPLEIKHWLEATVCC